MSRRPSKTASKKPAGAAKNQEQRLQRLLASAGFGSRRLCEELIEAGRVDVDGHIVTKLGTTVDASKCKVRVDGVLLKKQKLVYYAVNKPVGVVTTNSDPHGRPRVVDLVPKTERVFAVGRLDRSSEGLILLTNDGDLAQQLTHPKFGVRKVYRVTVAGKVGPDTMKQMRQGIFIADGRVRVDGARVLKTRGKATEMEIVLREGKNREIRRILARLGHKVQQLRRIAVGPLRLGDMPPGAYRVVSREEVKKLQRSGEVPPTDSSSNAARKAKTSSGKVGTGKASTGKTSSGKTSTAQRSGHTANKTKKPGTQRSPAKQVRSKETRSVETRSTAAKRSRQATPAASKTDFSGSRTIGAVIGADPSPESEAGTKKRTTRSQSAKPKGPAKRKGPTKRKGPAKRTSSTKRDPGSKSRSGVKRGTKRVAKRTTRKATGSTASTSRKPAKKGGRSAATGKGQRGKPTSQKQVTRKRKR